MATNPDLISPCGLYCGVCAIYIAHRDNNIKLKERLVNLYKGGTPGKGTLPNSEALSVEDIRCRGCLPACGVQLRHASGPKLDTEESDTRHSVLPGGQDGQVRPTQGGHPSGDAGS